MVVTLRVAMAAGVVIEPGTHKPDSGKGNYRQNYMAGRIHISSYFSR